MLYINDMNKKITILGIAKSLNVSTRTIYRNMTEELNREKELLNNDI
jgi:predicted DNA-binding transcriptional regulator YafY